MRHLLYLASGLIFGLGLAISQMVDPLKVKSFLNLGPDWNPALMFVLGSAAPTYFLAYLYIKKRQKTWDGHPVKAPAPRPIDKKLVAGAVLFGIGWGVSGVCPGPALFHLAYLDEQFLVFIIMMFLGFELQRKIV
jgi:uncharacterized membrane protein YedE/YeeE